MMVNSSLLPTSSPIDTLGAYAIIALIADPAAAKQRLDELQAERQAADVALEAAKVLNAQTAEQAAAVARDLAVAQELTAKHADDRKALDETAATLDAREMRVAALETEHAQRVADYQRLMDERDGRVTYREQQAAEFEKRIYADREKLNHDRAELDRRVAAVNLAVK